jgi:hypothetical protein
MLILKLMQRLKRFIRCEKKQGHFILLHPF